MKVKIEDNINLLRFAEEVTDEVKQSIKEYHFKTINAMKRDAPVDTGDLRDSIGGTISPNGLSSVIEATEDYAPYQELGTLGQYNSSYANSLGLDSYAKQFKRGNNGNPVLATRFFFKNSNANFIRLIDDFKV
jgi:hypothetical protein